MTIMEENEIVEEGHGMKPKLRKALLLLNCFLLLIGNSGGPLTTRLYYLHGGELIWLVSLLQTAAFPVLFVVLAVAYFNRRNDKITASKFFLMRLRLFVGGAVAGILTGCDDYLYTYGVSRIPVSTSALIIASQLVFTAGFAYVLVKQSFTPFSVNAIVLLTIGAAVLAMDTSSDLPAGESKRDYYIGFIMTVLAALLYGFVLPLIELVYQKAEQKLTYPVVMEFQLVMCVFATGFCAVGMIITNDFQAMKIEAKESDMGEGGYYGVLVSTAILWQCFYMGVVGVIFCASSLLSGIIIALSLPITEIMAVIFFKEAFKTAKMMSLVLSLWGFVSYFYGELRESRRRRQLELELAQDQLYP